jgi:hypothetical protein
MFVGLGLTATTVMAEPDSLLHVSVAFGRGLNTTQPQGNPVNNVVIPDDIQVKEDGVVHFLVSGFHQLVVYQPGTKAEDIVLPPAPPPATNNFINDPTTPNTTTQFYLGINPAGGPLGTAGTINPSNASNRVESVSFAERGTYLVICNIRSHFLNGMFGYVNVLP